VLERLSPARRNLVLLALALLLAWFAWSVRTVLNPLGVGYLAAYILMPLVVRLERRGLSRRAAVNWIFVTGFGVAALVLVGLAWQLRTLVLDIGASVRESNQGVMLHAELQRRADEFTATLRDLGLTVDDWQVPDLEALRAEVSRFLEERGGLTRTGMAVAGRGFVLAGRFLGGLVSVLGLFLLVPLYAYYFLFVIGDLHGSVRRYFPRRERERLTRVFERIGEVISSFFRGRLAVAFAKGLLLALGLSLTDMPYGFLLGMLSGALSIIPFAGAFTGFLLALLVGVLEHGVIGSGWRAGLVFGLGEVVEGYVLVPRILGDRLGLHPLVVFFALLAGGASLGMLGLLIALPLTATLVILFQEFVRPALRQFADEPG
jgi:predicted PurR-regulated permease PerM